MAKRTKKTATAAPDTVRLGEEAATAVLATLKRYGAQRFAHSTDKAHALAALAELRVSVTPGAGDDDESDDE